MTGRERFPKGKPTEFFEHNNKVHCVPNAELYCSKKAEHQPDKLPTPEAQKACRDAIVEACHEESDKIPWEHYRHVRHLGGERDLDMLAARKTACKQHAREKCTAVMGTDETFQRAAQHEKERWMTSCELDAQHSCEDDHMWLHGHRKLLVQRHGHPKGDEFDHNDEF